MFEALDHPYLVSSDGTFKLKKAPTGPGSNDPGKKKSKDRLDEAIEELGELQRRLYAANRRSVLMVFQAMDAAGKDGTIRAVTSGINPAGFQVFSFKQPSVEELDHDFLWRTTRSLPERGRIGIFNRSYYEEVLVVRVHPEYLANEHLHPKLRTDKVWEHRFESIREHERHLARNGTVILKFFLNISKDEQRKRFLSRIDRPEKNWKFSSSDVKERGHWDAYMDAYQDALRETSRPWAPWYAIPADNKPFMRMTVAQIFADTMKSLELRYPVLPEGERERLLEMRKTLADED